LSLDSKPRRHDAAAAAGTAAGMGNGAPAPAAVLPGGAPPTAAPAVLPGGASAARHVGPAAAAGGASSGARAGTVRRCRRGRGQDPLDRGPAVLDGRELPLQLLLPGRRGYFGEDNSEQADWAT